MLKALGRVAREAREDAGLTQARIAAAAGVTDPVLSHLERGERWPERVEEIVASYEKECGLSEGELWKRAAARL
jgi:transcriptional regulator with XRE-family HTH domain